MSGLSEFTRIQNRCLHFSIQCATSSCLFAMIHTLMLGIPSLSVRQYGSIHHFHRMKPSLCWEIEYIGSTFLADVSSVCSSRLQWWKWPIYCDQHGLRISGLSTSTAGSVITTIPLQYSPFGGNFIVALLVLGA